jgi:hypothetical protein
MACKCRRRRRHRHHHHHVDQEVRLSSLGPFGAEVLFRLFLVVLPFGHVLKIRIFLAFRLLFKNLSIKIYNTVIFICGVTGLWV